MTVASWFPAASYAVTRTVWSPSDQRRFKLVVMPTDCVGPPSMLTSYRAMPDAMSEPVHEIVTSGVVWTPLGEPPSVGGVRSTSIEVEAFGSTKPAVSQDWESKVWRPSRRMNLCAYLLPTRPSKPYNAEDAVPARPRP